MVKKSLFTFAFMALMACASAQTLQFELDGRVFENNEILICDVEPTEFGELAQDMQIRNLTGETIPVVVRKEEVKIVEGTETSFCWSGSCFGAETFESRPWPVEGNSVSMMGELSFHHLLDITYSGDPANFAIGTSVVRYYAYSSEDPDNAICLVMWFAYRAEGVNENNISLGHAYPNPASSQVCFNYQVAGQGNASVAIYNLLGQEVMNQALADMQGQVVLPVDNLNDGIYFCSIKLNGRAVKTEKFVVKKF